MATHKHYFDESLRINNTDFQQKTIIQESKFNTLNIGKREFNYFKDTYTFRYIKYLTENSKREELDIISFRFYIPNSFDPSEKNKDQWNRIFFIPSRNNYYNIPIAETPGRKCYHSQFFNHNLRILENDTLALHHFDVKNSWDQMVFYVPFIAHTDSGGFSDSLVDFYLKIPNAQKINQFNKDITSYVKDSGYNLSKGFHDLKIVGYEYDFPHYDKELQIMYYDRMDFYEIDDNGNAIMDSLITSL